MTKEFWQKVLAVQNKLITVLGGNELLCRGVGIKPDGSIQVNTPSEQAGNLLRLVLREEIDGVKIVYEVRGVAVACTEGKRA